MSLSSEWNEYFKIEEKHLTASAIRRLKIAVIAAIPIIPVMLGLDFTSSESHLAWHFITILVVLMAFIATLVILLNPVANSLMKNDQDLDEWGTSHKLAAQSFGFRITTGLIFILWLFCIIVSYIPQIPRFQMSVSLYDIGNFMLAILCFLWLTSTAHIAWTIRAITDEDDLEVREEKAVVSARKQRVEAAIIITVVALIFLAIAAGLFAWGYIDAHNAAGH